MAVLGAAVLYFAIVFGVGFVLGPVRIFWLEPRFGKTIAAVCEAPFLLIAMGLAAVWVRNRFGLANTRGLIMVGVAALMLIILADTSLGFAMRGIAWADQISYLSTDAGRIYLALLMAFSAMPVALKGCGVVREVRLGHPA